MLESKINPVFAFSQNEAYNISDSSENLSQQNEFNNNSPKKQNENDSNTKLTTKDNCKGKVEKIDIYTKSDDQIDETDEWIVFIKDLNKNKRHCKLFEGIHDSPEKQNESDSNITLTNGPPRKKSKKVLTPKDNCKGKVEKIDEYTKSDDQIEETDEWSVFIKDLKKNKRHSKLFEGIPDSPEKQNGSDSNITLTNVSNSEFILSSDEILSEKILEKRITQFLTNVQSDKSDENNTIPIPVKSKRQPRPPRKKSKKVQSKKDLNNLEDQVVDAIIIQESDLPSNGETLSEERLSNKVYDKWNVKIIEDSDFLKLYDNTFQNVETSTESVITNIQTLNIKIPKNINRPLELLSDIPDSTERKKMNDYSKGEDIVIIYEQTQCEVGPSEVRRVEEEDLENLKSLRPGCCHQPKNDEIYNSPEKQNGDASNIILGIPQIKRFKNMQQKSKKKIYHVTKGEKRNVNLVEVRLEDLQKKM